MKKEINLKTFVSKTVHELSNPLAIIMGRLQLLSLEAPNESSSIYHRSLESLHAATQRLSDITDDLKSVANVSKSSAELRSHEFAELVIAECQSMCADAEVNFLLNLGEDVTFTADKKLLVQATKNIICNGIEASRGMESPWISLRIFPSGSDLLIEVQNEGPRISAEDAQQCFLPFFSTKKKIGSRGMGLTLAQFIAHQHGGDIFIDESQSKTTFVLKIPLRPQVAAA